MDHRLHTTVLNAIERLEIKVDIVDCLPEYADTAQFCEHYGYPKETSANTIIVAGKADPKRYAACLIQATSRLDVNHTVRNLLGVRRASFATAQETQILTGMAIGGVTIFGLPDALPVYIDASLKALDYLVIGAGTRQAKLIIHPTELVKIPNISFIENMAMA